MSATLLAIAVAVSMGAAVGVAGAAGPPHCEATPTRTTQATLMQRLSDAARSLLAKDERRVVRPAMHRPGLRVADQRSMALLLDEADVPHQPTLLAHLLNLPPPASV